MKKLYSDETVYKKMLEATDYQIIREVEKLLPRLKQLLDDNGVDTSDVDLTKVDSAKRDHARLGKKAEHAKNELKRLADND